MPHLAAVRPRYAAGVGKLAGVTDQALAWALILLGAAHIGAGLVNFKEITASWLWFMGSGLALVAVGALNLARRWGRSAAAAGLCLAVNMLLLLFAVAADAIYSAEQPITAIALTAAAALLTFFAFRDVSVGRRG
jgi:hypothetical protein